MVSHSVRRHLKNLRSTNGIRTHDLFFCYVCLVRFFFLGLNCIALDDTVQLSVTCEELDLCRMELYCVQS